MRLVGKKNVPGPSTDGPGPCIVHFRAVAKLVSISLTSLLSIIFAVENLTRTEMSHNLHTTVY